MVTSVGLDLSLTASGVACARPTGVALWLVGREGVTNLSVADQMPAIDELIARIAVYLDLSMDPPDVAVLEALDNAQSYGGVTERTVLWWEMAKTLHHLQVPVYTPTSAQVKIYATGNGQSKKDAVIAAVATHWPDWQIGRNDNKADAAAMAELGLALAGCPTVELPKTHTRVLPNIRKLTDPPNRVTKPKKARAYPGRAKIEETR